VDQRRLGTAYGLMTMLQNVGLTVCNVGAGVLNDIGGASAANPGGYRPMLWMFTVLGAPDIIVLTLSEFAQQAYRICRDGELPLIVDADHGYGNALNVKRTVEELETAGVSALTIEDTVLPQPYGDVGNTRLIPLEEGVGKMKAALAGRQDKSLTIAGRTSAVQVTGIADAIKRAKAYQAAGVDAMFFTGIKTREELQAVAAEIKIPIFLGSIGPALSDKDFLSANGVRIALQGHQPVMAAIRATYETLKALRDGTPPGELKGVASPDLMKQVTRDKDFKRWTKEFLGG
jgi:carboxyvinyl-carboxyphosphonate phosphorylmutase